MAASIDRHSLRDAAMFAIKGIVRDAGAEAPQRRDNKDPHKALNVAGKVRALRGANPTFAKEGVSMASLDIDIVVSLLATRRHSSPVYRSASSLRSSHLVFRSSSPVRRPPCAPC